MTVVSDAPETIVKSALAAEAARSIEPSPLAAPPEAEPDTTSKLVIVAYSGDLEKTWATMILASSAAALGMKTTVFVTFWGLQTFVNDRKRVTGENLFQRMLSVMSRPGISHRKLSKLNMFGMGPWMMRQLAGKYGVSSPKELLEVAQALGVEFIPCQMTMDMFGLKREDFIEGMGEPAGAATALAAMTEPHTRTLFI